MLYYNISNNKIIMSMDYNNVSSNTINDGK